MILLLEELAVNVLLAGMGGFIVTIGLFGLFRLAIHNVVSIPFLLPDMRQILVIGFGVIMLNLIVSMIAYVYVILRLRNTEIALLVKEEN